MALQEPPGARLPCPRAGRSPRPRVQGQTQDSTHLGHAASLREGSRPVSLGLVEEGHLLVANLCILVTGRAVGCEDRVCAMCCHNQAPGSGLCCFSRVKLGKGANDRAHGPGPLRSCPWRWPLVCADTQRVQVRPLCLRLGRRSPVYFGDCDKCSIWRTRDVHTGSLSRSRWPRGHGRVLRVQSVALWTGRRLQDRRHCCVVTTFPTRRSHLT